MVNLKKRGVSLLCALLMTFGLTLTVSAAPATADGSEYVLETRSDGYVYCVNTRTNAVEIGMVLIDDTLYCFDAVGRMVTNKWYTDIEGQTYYFGEDGVAYIDGTYKINGDWYLFDEWGVRNEEGLVKLNGSYYYYSKKTGKRCTGRVQIGKAVYYFDTDTGKMTSGWVTISGDKYYFGNNGQMVTGTKLINGEKYTFGADGALID